jgi:putative transposase
MEENAQTVLSRDEMESRRIAAARELLTGVAQSNVARKYGVSRTTASRWHRALNGKGVDGLRKRRATGRPSRLTTSQLQELAEIYNQGASAFGFSTDRWTTARFAAAIYARFGVKYDPDHVGRLMHRWGLRSQAAAAYAVAPYPAHAGLGDSELLPTLA